MVNGFSGKGVEGKMCVVGEQSSQPTTTSIFHILTLLQRSIGVGRLRDSGQCGDTFSAIGRQHVYSRYARRRLAGQ